MSLFAYPFNIYGLKDLKYNIVHHAQRIYRPNHTSDRDIWSLDFHLAEIILPKLIAFQKANKHGTPIFDDYVQDENDDQEKARTKKWDDIIDQMIVGMKYVVVDGYGKKYKKYERELKRQFGDWDAKTEKNKRYHLWKHLPPNENGERMSQLVDDPSELSSEDIEELVKENGPNWLQDSIHYYNVNLHNEIAKKAQEGLKLFGEYFMNLWD